MKSRNFFMAVCAVFCMFSLSAAAQEQKDNKGKEDWGDRMKAEKVAFLTSELDLSSAEAEKFWPVYNEMDKERRDRTCKSMDAYKALDEAVKAGKSGSELKTLLDNYMSALKASQAIEAKYVDKLSKVISVEKVAKLFIGEENFRRTQIMRWHAEHRNNGPRQQPGQGNKPDGNRPDNGK